MADLSGDLKDPALEGVDDGGNNLVQVDENTREPLIKISPVPLNWPLSFSSVCESEFE